MSTALKEALNQAGYAFDSLVFIGRFQPFHYGHLHIVEKALEQAEQLIIVLGSAYKPRSGKHPFFASEREAMIRLALGEEKAARVKFVAMRDYFDNDKWAKHVSEAVAEFTPANTRVGIIGHDKDESSYYLHMFPQWEQMLLNNFENLNATDLRKLYFTLEDREESFALLATRLPAPVMGFLRAFARLDDYLHLCKAAAKISADKKKWEPAPYAPIFVTTDAVVRCNNHVLMVRRGGAVGYGQWALPGGYLEQDEKLFKCAIRELKEETELNFGDFYLEENLLDKDVFDYPGRDERGRIISHAYFFDLIVGGLPPVKGRDDALEAKWIPISELASMETMIFADHLAILDRFLHIL